MPLSAMLLSGPCSSVDQLSTDSQFFVSVRVNGLLNARFAKMRRSKISLSSCAEILFAYFSGSSYT